MSCLYSPVDGYFVFAFWYWFLIVKLSYRSSSFDILFKSLASCNNTFSFPLIIEMMLSALYMIYLPNVCLWHTFRASRYMMRLNRTSVRNVMTISISRDLPLFNFDCLHMWCAWIGPLCDKLWPFEFLRSFRCLISSVSIYYAPESDLRVKSYDHLNFSRASIV